MRESGLISISPKRAKSTSGTFGSPPPRPHPALHDGLDEGFHVIVGDAALAAAALDAGEIHAQFAGELAHRGAGMGLAETGFVDGRQMSRAAATLCAHRGAVCRGLGMQAQQHAVRLSERRQLVLQVLCSRSGFGGAASSDSVHHQHHGAFRDLVALLDLDRLDGAGIGRRHVHGGLVGLEGDEPCSLSTLSPALTITSMTSTSLKLPMSGTLISFLPCCNSLNGSGTAIDYRRCAALHRDRIGFIGIDAIFLHGFDALSSHPAGPHPPGT